MPRPKALTPHQARSTLAHRLGGRVDRIRQLATRLGIRPYRVFLVWTRATGAVVGEGEENIFARVEILPTPRVDLSAMVRRPWTMGILPEGTCRVDRVSVAFTNDQLKGLVIPAPRCRSATFEGQLLAGDWVKPQSDEQCDFFYEVVEDGRGDELPERRRFRLYGEPVRDAGNVSWSLMLEPASDPLGRDGKSQLTEQDVLDADDT